MIMEPVAVCATRKLVIAGLTPRKGLEPGDIKGTGKESSGMARKLLTDARETSYWI